MIGTEDLKTYSDIGKALWIDPRQSRRMSVETLAAASLLDLLPERTLEKAATGLLSRANQSGMAANMRANLGAITDPFYRLFPEERFILVALHVGRWSYERIGRVLGETAENVERLAWKARLDLASSLAAFGSARFAIYPTGTGSGPSCPEYDPERPWTQRFLDDQIRSGGDRLYLQNHMMSCRSCYQALNRARDLYYHVDSVIPRSDDAAQVGELQRVFSRTQTLKKPRYSAIGRAWIEVFSRKDVQIVVLLCVYVILGFYFLNR